MADFERPRIFRTPISNGAFGYPMRGDERRIEPTQLAIIHITGNSRTAAMAPLKGTRAEIAYMDRKGSNGPSAHTYIARDGSIFQCISAKRYAGWSNGDLIRPMDRFDYVAEMVRKARGGINPNELVHREYELTGGGQYRVTREQLESVAFQIARDSVRTGLPIKPLETVGIHAHINTVNRWNDPFRSKRVERIKKLCARAQEWKRHFAKPMSRKPDPDPDDPTAGRPPDDEAPSDEELCAALEEEAEQARAREAEMIRAFRLIGEAVEPYDDEEDLEP